ncbi:nucleotidyltransferase family protein [Actinacidiphila sp. ITFR-21]|uniref:nucleotidyltransferase family protein n=1 Tax=Actinacidiphila sp. ITFR-21 TaxID=3075199 RepID=UPI00288B5320|nr:nucleotidyltransferase family protein [Streptomyces sp. ITFR-21]WNI18564.1 nucleotidyltransferase family protein [Streptomyces sp. ITFR-21]
MDTEGEVAGLLLAAGGGRRLGGRPKALLPYRGRPLVEHAVRELRAGGCARVHVVLGAAADEVRERADLTGCVVVANPRWEEGMGSSLRAGLASLAARQADSSARRGQPAHSPALAALIGLVDQPGVGAASVARVLAAARAGGGLGAALAAATYGGRRGHPVLIGAARWAGVAGSADGDRGARTYLRAHAEQTVLVECGDVGDPADIDTPADLRLLDRADPAP